MLEKFLKKLNIFLTASVEPFDAGDVVGAHRCGPSKVEGRISSGKESRLAISGVGKAGRKRK